MALIAYPFIGLASGHALRTLPVLGVSPCATVVFFFGLLLWAQPPAPKYVLLVPLTWALGAARRIWPGVSPRTTACSSPR
jgi:Family of unknown function (DUF6064)